MNGNGEKRLDEMTDAELISFALSVDCDFLQDDSSTVNFGFWVSQD